MHHDVVGADRLRIAGELDHRVEALVGARQDGAVAANLIDRDLERALALGKRHREELALLAAYEHTINAEVVDPMAEVAAETLFVERAIGPKGGERRRPDALEIGAGIGLGIGAGETHGPPVNEWSTIVSGFDPLCTPNGGASTTPKEQCAGALGSIGKPLRACRYGRGPATGNDRSRPGHAATPACRTRVGATLPPVCRRCHRRTHAAGAPRSSCGGARCRRRCTASCPAR